MSTEEGIEETRERASVVLDDRNEIGALRQFA
jgi:hypothetical protein